MGRFALRGVAVLLLMMGLAGGAYLGKQAQLRPASLTVADTRAEAAELRMLDGILEERARAEQERLAEEREKAEREARKRAEAEEARRAREAEEAASRQQAESRSVPSEPVGPIPESCEEFGGNRAIGCALMVEAGFELEHMVCLDDLWSHESGWNELAQNPNSGAYGIPQALPGSKMAAFGDDWETNPATQIRWGLSYISGRYGSPCGAWDYFEANGWY
jgi:hypothetical protein